MKFMYFRELHSTALTPEAFAGYGKLLGKPTLPPDVEHGKWFSLWHALEEIPNERRLVWDFLELHFRPLLLEKLQCNKSSCLTMIPAGGISVLPVAKPTEESRTPDLDTLQLFLLDGSLTVILNPGIWFDYPYAIHNSAEFLMTMEHGEILRERSVFSLPPLQLSYDDYDVI